MHYLKTVDATGTNEAGAVMAKMRATPINDFMTTNGRIREDGRVMRDLYLLQVKSPAESHGEWDLAKVIATIPGEQAFVRFGKVNARWFTTDSAIRKGNDDGRRNDGNQGKQGRRP
jgi:hypothetical protein